MTQINFDKLDGLVPAIVQDAATNEVLMLGFMDRAAFERSIADGFVTFFSRTRQQLWTKGATSGNRLEIVSVTSDCDGTNSGFDCELTAQISGAVQIPVIASGGAGSISHFIEVFERGRADAALAASIFHFGVHNIRELKRELSEAGIPMRLPC
jgi:imidazole glycerol phosphate synthase subunit HisF